MTTHQINDSRHKRELLSSADGLHRKHRIIFALIECVITAFTRI
jgi:hypothetical protein